MVLPMVSPKTCPTLEAGSVLTSRHPLALAGQRDRGRARDRGLADPAFAGEEQKSRRSVQELHESQQQPVASEPSLPQQPLGVGGLEQVRRHRGGHLDTGPGGELGAIGVAAGHRGDAVDQDQRQPVGAGDVQERLHGVVLGERERLAGEVVADDVTAAAADEVQVGGERHQLLVDVLAADAGGAAQRGLEYFDLAHRTVSSGCR